MATRTIPPALGAFPSADATTFRVWAPHAGAVEVLSGTGRHRLDPQPDGLFAGQLALGTGVDYRFSLDGGAPLPDPFSRAQPYGLDGPSRVTDLAGLRAGQIEPGFAGLELATLVIYELHVGTFTPAGTFDAAIGRLAELADLGVSAVEVMPIATFDGERGWGYDSVYTFAPHRAYGGPEGFTRFIAAAHAAGLGVILDVVYNHMGAGSDRVEAFGPYTTPSAQTFWGEAIDYSQWGAREWAIQNAEMWIGDYGLDGLRLDAVHAIFDDTDPHVLRELAERVKRVNPRALVIAETGIGDLRPIKEWGHDAQWGDALHHACHVLLTGEHEGYYADYGRVADLSRELARPQGQRFVVCAQNHDQVGNRALGDRLPARELRLAAFCAILSRGTPLLFQGEEYDERHPFLYFTDHTDPEIARQTRDGRRAEFAAFSSFNAKEIPDPQDPDTFVHSKLDPARGDSTHRAYYRQLLALRHELPDELTVEDVDEARRLVRWRRGQVEFVANFSDSEEDAVPPRSGVARALGGPVLVGS